MSSWILSIAPPLLLGLRNGVGFRGLKEVRFSCAVQRRNSQKSYGKFIVAVEYFEKTRKWAFTETYTFSAKTPIYGNITFS